MRVYDWIMYGLGAIQRRLQQQQHSSIHITASATFKFGREIITLGKENKEQKRKKNRTNL